MYNDYRSLFKQNAASKGGAILALQSQVGFRETIFEYNYAENGGALSIDAFTILEIQYLTARFNYAVHNGGVISASGKSETIIEDSTFANNSCGDSGSVLYFVGTENNEMNKGSITGNNAGHSNTVMLVYSDMQMSFVNFYDNVAQYFTNGVYITHSDVEMRTCNFKNNKFPGNALTLEEAAKNSELYGGFIYIGGGTENVYLYAVNFYNGYAAYGGHVYIARSVNTVIFSSVIGPSYAKIDGGAFYFSDVEEVEVYNSEFSENIAISNGNTIYSNSGILAVVACNVTMNSASTSIYVQRSKLIIRFSIFYYGSEVISQNTDTVLGNIIFGMDNTFAEIYN